MLVAPAAGRGLSGAPFRVDIGPCRVFFDGCPHQSGKQRGYVTCQNADHVKCFKYRQVDGGVTHVFMFLFVPLHVSLIPRIKSCQLPCSALLACPASPMGVLSPSRAVGGRRRQVQQIRRHFDDGGRGAVAAVA
eukprot:4979463-Pyramimonas_sp.AAC.1